MRKKQKNCVQRSSTSPLESDIVLVTNNGRTIFDAFSLDGKLFGVWGTESLDDLHAMYVGKTSLFRKPLSYVTPSGASIGESHLRESMQRSFIQLHRNIQEGYTMLLGHKTFASGYENIAMPARKMYVINSKDKTKV